MSGWRKTAPIFALALAAGVAASAALAEDETQVAALGNRLQSAFGSTIVSTYPDGRQAELWLKRDGTYQAEGRRHDRSSGVWQLKNDKGELKLCLKQRQPFPAPFSYCPAVPEGGIDRPWTSKAFTGEQTSVRLVRGVYDPARGGQQDGGQNAQASRGEDKG